MTDNDNSTLIEIAGKVGKIHGLMQGMDGRLDKMDDNLDKVEKKLDRHIDRHEPKRISGKAKAAMISAAFTGVAGIVVTIIKVFPW